MDDKLGKRFKKKLEFILQGDEERLASIEIPRITVKDLFKVDSKEKIPCKGEPLVDFGIVKDGLDWTLIEKYRKIFDPILIREAILLSLHKKYRRKDSIKHACNWMAYKFTEKRTVQRDFWDAWEKLARYSDSDKYVNEPTMYLEFERLSVLEARDILRMILEKKNVISTGILTWFKTKARLYSRIPNPAIMELCFAASKIFIEKKEPPDREEIFERALQNQHFTRGDLNRKVMEENFYHFRSSFISYYYINRSLLDTIMVFTQFTIGASISPESIREIFRFPGMSIRLNIYSGNLVPASKKRKDDFTYGLDIVLPRNAMGHYVKFMKDLEKLGVINSLEISTIDKVLMVKNFNQYIGNPENPRFTWNSLRDDEELVLTTTVDYLKEKGKGKDFIQSLELKNFQQFKKYLDANISSYDFKPMRYGAWSKRLSLMTGATRATISQWQNTFIHSGNLLIPVPRFYPIDAHIGADLRFLYIILPSRSRVELLKFIEPFVACGCKYQVTTDKEKSIHLIASVPERYTSKALLRVKEDEPEALIANLIFLANFESTFREFAWYNPEKGTHENLEPLFADYLKDVPDLLQGKIKRMEFKKRTYSKWDQVMKGIPG